MINDWSLQVIKLNERRSLIFFSKSKKPKIHNNVFHKFPVYQNYTINPTNMNTNGKYWFLRHHRLFDTLDDDQVNDLCIITRFKTASKAEVVYFADEPIQRIYLLKRGMIKIVQTTDDGEEVIKDIIQQGDLFGELSLNPLDKNTEYAEVISPEAVICSFTLDHFEKLLSNYPSLALIVYKTVGSKLKKMETRYSNLVFKDVEQRLIDFIKDWAKKEGTADENNVVIHNYLTQQDIANLICATRQTVTQLFNAFKQRGIIQYDRKEIVIPNLEQLK